MAIKRSGWNPKKEVTEYEKKRMNNPRKIENAENYLRDWPTWNDDNAMRLNDTENGEGISRRKKNTREVIEDAFRKVKKK
jgi:hypothetical protein